MVQIMNHNLRYNNRELGNGNGWLFTSLLLHADHSLLCWPSDATLESEGCGSQPTVQKRREWLVERGAIIPIPFEKRPAHLKNLHYKKIVYQITGVIFIKNNPKDKDSTFKILPTIFMTTEEQMESLTEQLNYLDFFSQYNLTRDNYPKVFLPKDSLGKDSLAKETLYEVNTVLLSKSKASSETKVSDSVQQDAESPDDGKKQKEQEQKQEQEQEQEQESEPVESLADMGIALYDADGNPVSATTVSPAPEKKDFSTEPPDELKPVDSTPMSESEWLDLWIKAVLWTTDSHRLWKGFNKANKNWGFGQQVNDASTMRISWQNFIELYPDNDELRSLMPLDIMRDYYGFEKGKVGHGKAKKSGWLFSAQGKNMKTDLTMGSAMLVRWFNEYLTSKTSVPYKKTQGEDDERNIQQLASKAQPKSGLYTVATDEKREEIKRKMFENKKSDS